MSLSDEIKRFLEIMPTLTQAEADFIEDIIKWDADQKAAFLIVKDMAANQEKYDEIST